MANLIGANGALLYKGILNLDATTINTPFDATLRAVTDGMGNTSPLQLSTASVSFGGASGLNWDNANIRLGIGTINPTETLSIIGNIDIPAITGKIGFYVGDIFTTYGSTAAHYGMSYIGAQSTVILSGYAALRMFTVGTERLSILANGNVGIGVTSPTARLNVKGDGTTPIMRLETLAGTAALRLSNDGLYLNFGSSAFAAISPANATGNADIAGNGLRFFSNYGSQINATGYNFCTVNGSISPTSGTSVTVGITESFGAAAGTASFRPLSITYTINNSGPQTGTATATGIFLNATETALNGMNHNLIDLQRGGVSRFSVSTFGLATAGTFSTGNEYQFVNGTRIRSTDANGRLLISNNNLNDFDRLQLGGTTNAFPAIKRNGAAIEFRLADDSGFAAINSGSISCTSNFSVTTSMSLGGSALFGFNDLGSLTASAVLEARSTTKGFLPPRMTDTEVRAITSPADGLIVYNTTISHLCVRQGGVWVRINHSPM
jgi:hypothetical protein